MWCPETTMADPSYILFNKTLEQARRLGARGGRASAPLPTVPLPLAPTETTAEAVAVLDAQFPWLRGAEKRRFGSQPSCPLMAARTAGSGDFLELSRREEIAASA